MQLEKSTKCKFNDSDNLRTLNGVLTWNNPQFVLNINETIEHEGRKIVTSDLKKRSKDIRT